MRFSTCPVTRPIRWSTRCASRRWASGEVVPSRRCSHRCARAGDEGKRRTHPQRPARPRCGVGFRRIWVARKVRESANVISLLLEPTDGQPIAAALPGRFVVLRLGAPSSLALMRSYSLSGKPGAMCYRVSIKREAHGAASTFVDGQLKIADIVHVSAPRGNFTLRPGDTPVVFMSAGIGVTPVLAMLHALEAEAS